MLTRPETIEQSAPEIDLGWIFAVCFERWRTIAGTTVIVALLALVYAFLAPPIYRATGKIVIDPRPQRILASEEVLPGLTSDASAIETQVQLIASGSVAERVLREIDGRSAEQRFTDLQVRDFLSNLVVARRGLTYVVDVTYSARDPMRAADIANRVARAYIAEEAQAGTEAATKANEWLQDRVKTLGPKLMALEKEIQEYRLSNNLIAIGDQSLSERNIADYIAQLGLARAAAAEAEAALKIDRSKSAVSLQSQDVFEIAKAKVAIMEQGLQSLTAELGTNRLRDIELQNMLREAAAMKTLYESLLKRQTETDTQQKLSIVNARLVEEALPPTYAYWPRKSILLAAGLFVGFTCGVFWVIFREYFQTRSKPLA